jgi:heptosyltransferase-3
MARTCVIIHPGSLGDVLLAVPAMKRLRGRFPRHGILLIANDSAGRLLHDLQLIDAWMAVEGRAGSELFNDSASVSGELMGWLERCDFAVAWMQDPEGKLAALLHDCGVQEVRIQSPFCCSLKARHQSDRFLETLDEPGVDPSTEEGVRVPRSLVDWGRSYLASVGITADRPLALVHPGSGSSHKCVSSVVLGLAIEQLRQDGMVPLLIEGPADAEVVAGLLKQMAVRTAVLRRLNLSFLAGVIAQAALFLGHDSGLTHLSALLGVPTVAMFGPTDPDRWAPRGPQITVLQGATCRCESWEVVRACTEKPCLAISVEQLIALCRVCRPACTTPRNSR